MNRRQAMLALGATLVAPVAAGTASRAPRIAALLPRENCDEIARTVRPNLAAALASLGHPGVVFENHCFGNDWVRAEAIVREVLREGVDVLAVEGTPATRLAARLTRTVPIMSLQDDPVASGFVRDLTRPEGNVTGFSNIRPETPEKVIELLRLAIPGLKRAIVVSDAGYPGSELQNGAYVAAANAVGLAGASRVVEAGAIGAVFAAMKPGEAAYLPWALLDRERTAALALRHRVATMLNTRGYVEEGGLLSYSLHNRDPVARQAALLDKLLRGVPPRNIPWELPDRSHLAVNLGTAKALGLRIPPELLLRADQVVRD